MDQLPLPLQWIVEGGFWRTFFICLLICPIIPQLLGIVFCSYWTPWSPKRQFTAYIPGNPFLALFLAGASTVLDEGFHIPVWFNLATAAVTLGFYIGLNFLDRGAYDASLRRSANKRFHNLLYFWYAYLAIVCFYGLLASEASWMLKLLISLPGIAWLACMGIDNFASQERKAMRFAQAHADNVPIWKTGWRLRKFNPATGRYEVPWGPHRDPFSTSPLFGG
jgi:hypothetical protein